MAINHVDKIENNDQLKRPYFAPAVTFLSVWEVENKAQYFINESTITGPS